MIAVADYVALERAEARKEGRNEGIEAARAAVAKRVEIVGSKLAEQIVLDCVADIDALRGAP